MSVFLTLMPQLGFAQMLKSDNVKSCGNGPVVCWVFFGLHNAVHAPEYLIIEQMKNIEKTLGHDRARIYDDTFYKVLDQLKQGFTKEEVAFWIVAYNPSPSKQEAIFYSTRVKEPTYCPWDSAKDNFDGFGDHTLDGDEVSILETLKKDADRVNYEQHKLSLAAKEAKLLGVSPGMPELKNESPCEKWPVALLKPSVINSLDIQAKDVIMFGYIEPEHPDD
ncbi:hypothetical protein ACN9MF_20110 [Methylobacterium fujisawaense]|uniref:hypothetical protein n=1 Tax=Methylobacterium fujisawaense TaxID=107400 RepID=UPI003CF0F460